VSGEVAVGIAPACPALAEGPGKVQGRPSLRMGHKGQTGQSKVGDEKAQVRKVQRSRSDLSLPLRLCLCPASLCARQSLCTHMGRRRGVSKVT